MAHAAWSSRSSILTLSSECCISFPHCTQNTAYPSTCPRKTPAGFHLVDVGAVGAVGVAAPPLAGEVSAEVEHPRAYHPETGNDRLIPGASCSGGRLSEAPLASGRDTASPRRVRNVSCPLITGWTVFAYVNSLGRRQFG
jgi:hypothetical protein